MPFVEPKYFMFQIMLPDGKHLLVHKCHMNVNTQEDVEKLYKELDKAVSQNPDAKVLYETVRQFTDHSEVEAAAKKLREEDPSRPLATDLGLDATNRLLADPSIARTIAAARSVDSPSEA